MPEEIKVPTAEEIAGSISAMRDSVWVINSEIVKEEITKEVIDTVGRNVGHLELMLSKEEIIGAGEDLTDVEEAVTAGKAFIEEHS
jgi:hypothetical protein